MINIQAKMKELFGGACLGYCYAYVAIDKNNRVASDKALTEAFLNGWLKGYINNDGYVSSPVDYLKLLGLYVRDIKKVDIEYLNDLPDDGLYAVEYELNGGSHFVVAKKGSVVFDPSGDSNSVKYGSPISYRKFIYH